MLKLETREEQQRQKKVIRAERARKDAEGPMADAERAGQMLCKRWFWLRRCLALRHWMLRMHCALNKTVARDYTCIAQEKMTSLNEAEGKVLMSMDRIAAVEQRPLNSLAPSKLARSGNRVSLSLLSKTC